jgi:ribosomal protein S18 acetylase RimI-like enzyme
MRVQEIDEVSFAVPWSPAELKEHFDRKGVFGAVSAGKEEVLGYCLMQITDEDPLWLNITTIAVDPWARREGIGTILVDYAKFAASAKQLDGIEVLVSDRLLSAHKFFQNNGFFGVEVIPGDGPDRAEDFYRMRWFTKSLAKKAG